MKNKNIRPTEKQNIAKAKTARTAEACHVSESTAKRCRREAEKESKENNDGETAEVKKKFKAILCYLSCLCNLIYENLLIRAVIILVIFIFIIMIAIHLNEELFYSLS